MKPIEFHTFSYGCLSLFIDTYFTSSNVASCTFGGKERNRLFITTAVDGLSEAEIQAYPLSGSLFVADVPGVVSGENHYPFIIR